MNVCRYTHIHVSMNPCVSVCYPCIHAHEQTLTHGYMHTYTHTHMHMNVCMYTCTRTDAYTCIHGYMYVCAYMHTNRRLHMDTYTHTLIHMDTYTHTLIHSYTYAYAHITGWPDPAHSLATSIECVLLLQNVLHIGGPKQLAAVECVLLR